LGHELQALLDENSARTLEELAEALNIGQSTVSDRLRNGKNSKRKQMGLTYLNCLNSKLLFKIV